MPSWEIDLRSGDRTHKLELEHLPFRSQFGAGEGEMRILTDPDGHPKTVQVTLVTPKVFLVEQLEQIARQAVWPVPVEELRALATEQVAVDMVLRSEFVPDLETLDVDDPLLPVSAGWYASLMDDRNYQIDDIRAYQEPR